MRRKSQRLVPLCRRPLREMADHLIEQASQLIAALGPEGVANAAFDLSDDRIGGPRGIEAGVSEVELVDVAVAGVSAAFQQAAGLELGGQQCHGLGGDAEVAGEFGSGEAGIGVHMHQERVVGRRYADAAQARLFGRLDSQVAAAADENAA